MAAAVAMAVALKKNCDAIEENAQKLCSLEEALLQHLRNTGTQFVQNGTEKHLPGLISLSFLTGDGEAILHRMDLLGVCISTGSACNSKSKEISHVLRAIHLDDELAKGTIRISLGRNNTIDDVEKITAALQKALS